MKYKEISYGGGFSVSGDGGGAKVSWQSVFENITWPASKNKTPRGPAYKRMVRNGII